MQSQSRRFYLLTIILCTTLGAAAQNPSPTSNGTWKLNAAKSEAGQRELPDIISFKVTSRGSEFDVLQTATGGELLLKFRSDGKEAVNQLPNGAEMKSTHRMENGVLLGEYRIRSDQGEFTQLDRIFLSADGKTLTTDREVKSSEWSFKQKLVFDRQ